MQDGNTLDNELEIVEGMKLDRGYISPYFITNQKNQKCVRIWFVTFSDFGHLVQHYKFLGRSVFQELEDPLILIHEKKISNLNAVVKVLELALKVTCPI